LPFLSAFASKDQDFFSLQKEKFDPHKEFNFDTLYYEAGTDGG